MCAFSSCLNHQSCTDSICRQLNASDSSDHKFKVLLAAMRYATAALSAMKAKDAAGRPEDDVAYISLLLVWLQSIVVYILAVVVELWWQFKVGSGGRVALRCRARGGRG